MLASYVLGPVYGIATYVKGGLLDYDVTFAGNDHDIPIINLLIGGMNVINIYKPPAVT